MKIYFIFILIILFGASCSKEDTPTLKRNDKGELISIPYLWKKRLHKSNPQVNGRMDTPIYLEKNIVIPMTDGPLGRLLSMINTESGNTIWEWDERFVPETEEIVIYMFHLYQNILFYNIGSRLYAVNIKTGETHWRKREDRSFWSHTYGKGAEFYIFGRSDAFPDSIDQSIVFKGDMYTGKIEEYLTPNFTGNHLYGGNRIGSVPAAVPIDFDGKEHLIVVWQEGISGYNLQSYLGLWDKTNGEWIYEKSVIVEPSLNGTLLNPPVIYNDRVYLAVGFELACHDIRSGKQLWKRRFDGETFFSNFLIEEGKLVVNNEDQFVYCLDPISGTQLWKTRGSGTSSYMSYLNGVVYFVGGATGNLHAVDIGSGKTVWKIDINNLGESGDRFRTSAVYVTPGENNKKGKVIALGGLNAYCFEAYR
ncbi:PQQ-binding-like beta-propeller repeat protein [Belliella sp. DSM 111904]|uniref:PQQ-binding-like beta-propeller repeat protein n=1 Tax=Belliella filtrata TaxID=2923435 RepID=A0ABS9V324_9BACT|nr:PQQ-binding-like beta-propeller repeat protein [Belliella filtrata]MCH7410819.1 PQQ-binding-like beta-propeller repeat protein [Belliella filtrata]